MPSHLALAASPSDLVPPSGPPAPGGGEKPGLALRLEAEVTAAPGSPYAAPPLCDTAARAAAFLHGVLGFEADLLGVLLLSPLGRALGHFALRLQGGGAAEGWGGLAAGVLGEGVGVVVFQTRPLAALRPSLRDRALARWLRRQGSLVGLPIHDHLLLGPPPAWVSLLGRNGARR